MLPKKTFLTLLFVLYTILSFSQKVDCITVQEVDIPFNKDVYKENTQLEDSYNYNLIYYTDDDDHTIWYKLNIKKDCQLRFSVLPSDPNDDYDFMLYKYSNLSFCNDYINDKLVAININEYNKTTSNNTNEQTTIANQKEIKVIEGETYYISVMNIFGEDCGHQLYIEACNSSMILNAVKKPCFRFSQPVFEFNNSLADFSKKESISVKNTQNNEELLIIEDSVVIRGHVRDNDNSKSIDAFISFEDDVTGQIFNFKAKADGGFIITLERARRYNLKCSSLGYYNIKGVIEFLKPSTYDFYLLKVKEGESFVLNNLMFYPATYALVEESIYELEDLANYLNNNPEIKIEIQGHTENDNYINTPNPIYAPLGEEWNYVGTAQKLSALRADAVKHYLVSKGISAERMSTIGLGAEHKLIENPISDDESKKNMRVEIKITKREQQSIEYTPSGPE